jgi:hypothetical protein
LQAATSPAHTVNAIVAASLKRTEHGLFIGATQAAVEAMGI